MPLLVLIAAYAVPGFVIPNGVNGFEGENRYRAQAALYAANTDLNGNDPGPEEFEDEVVEALTTTAYRVEEVGTCPGLAPYDPSSPAWRPGLTREEGEREFRKELGEGLSTYPLDVFTDHWHYRVRLYTIFGIPHGTDTLTCARRR